MARPPYYASDLYFINAIREVLGMSPIFDHGKKALAVKLRQADGRKLGAKRIDVSAYQRFGLPADNGNRMMPKAYGKNG